MERIGDRKMRKKRRKIRKGSKGEMIIMGKEAKE